MLYRSLLRPLLFRLPPETAHDLALSSLSFSPKFTQKLLAERYQRSPFGALRRFGLTFSNPVGLAAGFDKNGEAADALGALGFGFVEVGTVTNESQPGNPRPRIFRLPRDRALINRLGFNNSGAKQIARNLKARRPDCVMGINIGKSRSVPIERAIPDYLSTFSTVYQFADYIAVNVSSPNTPQLRELQQPDLLNDLLEALQRRNRELAEKHSLSSPRPLLLKISPDLNHDELRDVVGVAQERGVSGIIATNTTVHREGLRTPPDR